MFNQYPDVLTVEMLSRALGIGINKAYELVNKRIIGSKRVGRKILVPKSCLVDYLDSSRYTVSGNGRQV